MARLSGDDLSDLLFGLSRLGHYNQGFYDRVCSFVCPPGEEESSGGWRELGRRRGALRPMAAARLLRALAMHDHYDPDVVCRVSACLISTGTPGGQHLHPATVAVSLQALRDMDHYEHGVVSALCSAAKARARDFNLVSMGNLLEALADFDHVDKALCAALARQAVDICREPPGGSRRGAKENSMGSPQVARILNALYHFDHLPKELCLALAGASPEVVRLAVQRGVPVAMVGPEEVARLGKGEGRARPLGHQGGGGRSQRGSSKRD